jgi:hypothetical protein
MDIPEDRGRGPCHRRPDIGTPVLGQASALGRQIVLVAPPKLATVPSHLKRFLVIRAGPRNRNAIDFALDQILASPERPVNPPIISAPTRPALGPRADSIQAKRSPPSRTYRRNQIAALRA